MLQLFRDKSSEGGPVPSSLDVQINSSDPWNLIDDVAFEAGDDNLTHEQPEPAAREDPFDLVLRGTQGRLRRVEGGFPQRLPPSRRGR